MNNTAIRAELQTTVFASENRRDFYYEYLQRCRYQKAGVLC